MQTPEHITQSSTNPQTNTVSWQWEASHFMPTKEGIMAFIPAGPREVDEEEAPVKVLQFPDDPHIIGLGYKEIVIPMNVRLLDHLLDTGRKNGGKALVSIISLPRDLWIATPLVAFEVTVEEVERLRKLVIMETQA
ncbi:MAG TPA: hypothetical protein ENJ28_03400 [Gammaproteobacteria bacterium]|nr:hypothetical protein [Gammaproteobacteria bacterium]